MPADDDKRGAQPRPPSPSADQTIAKQSLAMSASGKFSSASQRLKVGAEWPLLPSRRFDRSRPSCGHSHWPPQERHEGCKLDAAWALPLCIDCWV